jgi:hypothetical protein
MVHILREEVKGDQYKGINLSNVNIGQMLDKDASDADKATVSFARLIGGSILVHNLLMVMRNIYGVKNILQFDVSKTDEVLITNIKDVIDDYARVAEYFVMADTLGAIK